MGTCETIAMLYAQHSRRRSRQMIGDFTVLLWCAAWVMAGSGIHDAVETLGKPSEGIRSAAESLSKEVGQVGRAVPGPLRGPFNGVSGSAQDLSRAASEQTESVDHLAMRVGLAVGGIPTLLVLVPYASRRSRWMNEYRSIRALGEGEASDKLLARRALAGRNFGELLRVSDDPERDFESGHWAALANLERLHLGLAPRQPNQIQASSPPS